MCRFDDDPPLRWYECRSCDGAGYTVHRVTVYEPGCGFPHDDSDERQCETCGGAGGYIDDETPDYRPERPCPPIKMQEGLKRQIIRGHFDGFMRRHRHRRRPRRL